MNNISRKICHYNWFVSYRLVRFASYDMHRRFLPNSEILEIRRAFPRYVCCRLQMRNTCRHYLFIGALGRAVPQEDCVSRVLNQQLHWAKNVPLPGTGKAELQLKDLEPNGWVCHRGVSSRANTITSQHQSVVAWHRKYWRDISNFCWSYISCHTDKNRHYTWS